MSHKQASQDTQNEDVTPPRKRFLIRHGERADQAPSDPWYIRPGPRRWDCPLTAHGRLAAQPPKCRVVYSSPLRRCLETASEIAYELKVAVRLVFFLLQSRVHISDGALDRAPNRRVQAGKKQQQISSRCMRKCVSRDFYEDGGVSCISQCIG